MVFCDIYSDYILQEGKTGTDYIEKEMNKLIDFTLQDYH